MFSSKISHFWAENTFFSFYFLGGSGLETQINLYFLYHWSNCHHIFLHMVLISLPTYPAMNLLIESPLLYFLVCVLIKMTILEEIPSRPGQRELPIALPLCSVHGLKRDAPGCSRRLDPIDIDFKKQYFAMNHLLQE